MLPGIFPNGSALPLSVVDFMHPRPTPLYPTRAILHFGPMSLVHGGAILGNFISHYFEFVSPLFARRHPNRESIAIFGSGFYAPMAHATRPPPRAILHFGLFISVIGGHALGNFVSHHFWHECLPCWVEHVSKEAFFIFCFHAK